MTYKYTVSGLDCPNCAKKLTAIIEGKDAVDSVKLNFLTEDLTVVTGLGEQDALELVRACGREFSKKVSIDRK